MTTQQIHIGGRKRPINFTFEVAYHYERTTGRKYLTDLGLLFGQLSAGAAFVGSDDPGEALDHISIVLLADLVTAALEYGAKKSGTEFDGTPEEVGAWLMQDPQAAVDVFTVLADSLPKSDDAKKKATTNNTTTVRLPKQKASTGRR